MFMGDLTLTHERYQAVEFTFFTLADSEAFLTHAPGTLNEALALIRPFHWKVWPPLILSAVVAGPVLYMIIKLQLKWRTVNVSKSNLDRLFSDCVWFILVILLKQNGKFPSYTSTGRMMALLLSLSATYVIVDLYSANLTSILARPHKEQPIRNLEQLVDVMKSKQYQTVVEKNSASQSMLENGTGVLVRDLWSLMKRQQTYLIDSNEDGMLMVQNRKDHVLLGGRETLFYDAKRFGDYQILYNQASSESKGALERVNWWSLTPIKKGLFQYPLLPPALKVYSNFHGRNLIIPILHVSLSTTVDNAAADVASSTDEDIDGDTDHSKTSEETDEKKLKPLSMKPLQGCFYILLIGYVLSALVFLTEIFRKRSPQPQTTQEIQSGQETRNIYYVSHEVLLRMRRHHTRQLKPQATRSRSIWRYLLWNK
ncbi:ionotropic receptor 40a [Diaphorina citri]|uniref:Ionotropic receptor 40a n=1 Tax=Diaphorina citri TaxID=121845 RepID=A0A3Q0J8H7_DIACI|nr:ionotropic receptor 40a [Diaphorina citri]